MLQKDKKNDVVEMIDLSSQKAPPSSLQQGVCFECSFTVFLRVVQILQKY